MKILFMSALFTALGIQWFFMETVSLKKPTSLTMLTYCQVKIVTVCFFPEYHLLSVFLQSVNDHAGKNELLCSRAQKSCCF